MESGALGWVSGVGGGALVVSFAGVAVCVVPGGAGEGVLDVGRGGGRVGTPLGVVGLCWAKLRH